MSGLTITKTFDGTTGSRASPGSAFGGDSTLAGHFFDAVDTACGIIEARFCAVKTRTIEIQFGWGTVGGVDISVNFPTDVARSSYFVISYSYTDLHSLISGNTYTNNSIDAYNSLTDPTGGSLIYITQAMDEVLAASDYSGVAGYCGLNDTKTFFWTGGNGGSSGTGYDAVGSLMHEIAEVMGQTGKPQIPNGYGGPMDLFAWTSAGTRATPGSGTVGYFSVDSGTTNLGNFGSGDHRDWGGLSSPNGVDCRNANGTQGSLSEWTTRDDKALDATGWQSSILAVNTLTADKGSFTLTGEAATLTYNKLTAAQGSFTLAGQDVGFTYGRRTSRIQLRN